jgi:hypothetical protein
MGPKEILIRSVLKKKICKNHIYKISQLNLEANHLVT